MWREILCIVEERIVAADNTVAWNGKRLQLPESRLRPHFVKAQVRVHEYPDRTCAVFLGPHRLADYDAEAILRVPTAPKPGVVLGAVKDKPCRARSRASLTPAVIGPVWMPMRACTFSSAAAAMADTASSSQQMRWSLRGAHMLMQVRTADINGELRDRLRAEFRKPGPSVPSVFRPKPLLLSAA
jgi:hypothetical protein